MTKKTKSVLATTVMIACMTLSFKILGFVKQSVIAYYFGTTGETDAYNLAYTFVGTMTSALVRAISISMVSIYTHTLIQKGKDAASKLICACLEFMLPIAPFILLLVYMLTPVIAKILGPAYTPSETAVLKHYLYICYPLFVFSIFTMVGTALMDSNKDFAVSRTESFFTSTVTIICCILLYSTQAVTSLVIAQYLSYFLFITLLFIRSRRYVNFQFVRFKDVPELKVILTAALPVFIGNSVFQINKIVDGSISSSLGEGNATALAYAIVLEDLVINVIVNNVVDVLYVNFSNYAAEGNTKKLSETMTSAVNAMICIMAPISIITCLCATEIVTIVFKRGQFDETSVAMTSAALIGYGVGFISAGVRDIASRGLYAFKDTKGPMYTGFFAVACNIFFSILLSRYIGIMGVTLASSIFLTVNFIINSFILKKYIPDYSLLVYIPVLLKQLPGAIVLVLIIYFFKNTFSSNILIFGLSAVVGLTMYFVILTFMHINEITLIKEKLIAKLQIKKDR
ncbi:putative peptidoglycan lipid II flippase [Pseudobutyrivibrio sp. UC1225]|uniref:murein biosynthesis integral membrane protein MurJ n=1 Tax=Pseudobutyrivibrio sp. UC1225 TaxID=1798185 RepID=UPI0008E7F54B|nr:lipid II flippase MurJ [Pseudobutyrivibrio sp. UC1225]SFN77931.1 putative peptidoglycan lipid II flippase [Pseudobutyrivibrio sp. UC1225]